MKERKGTKKNREFGKKKKREDGKGDGGGGGGAELRVRKEWWGGGTNSLTFVHPGDESCVGLTHSGGRDTARRLGGHLQVTYTHLVAPVNLSHLSWQDY